jgi:hypothetical protein
MVVILGVTSPDAVTGRGAGCLLGVSDGQSIAGAVVCPQIAVIVRARTYGGPGGCARVHPPGPGVPAAPGLSGRVWSAVSGRGGSGCYRGGRDGS